MAPCPKPSLVMTTKKLSAATLIFCLLFFSTFSSACDLCMPKRELPVPPPEAPPVPPPEAPPVKPFCPIDTMKLGACADLLGGVENLLAGSSPLSKCCTLLEGLADSEAAACLCTAIKANVLGMNLNVPSPLSMLVSACGKSIPPGFQCG